MPASTAWSQNNTFGPQHPAQWYNNIHLGYLVRAQSDLSSMAADYFYVYRKDALSANNINLYRDMSKSLWQ